jgi:hypothetical protein
MLRLCSMQRAGYYGRVICPRSAFLVGLLAAAIGCDPAAPEAVASVAPPAEPAPAADPPPAAPPTDPVPAEPPADGQCATSESCSSEAATEERAKHFDKAAALYERACELSLPQACHRAGELYRDGKGVTPDDARARALFERGCREGSTSACDALGH